MRNISLAYKKIVYWKKSLFLFQSEQAGKNFIDEVSGLKNEWIHQLPLKDITFKAIMAMTSLILQKPLRKLKSKDHLKLLENRMELWQAEIIQKSLKSF